MKKYVVVNCYIRDAQRLYIPADMEMSEDEFEEFRDRADEEIFTDEEQNEGMGWGDANNVEEFIGIIEAGSEEEALSQCQGWNNHVLKAYEI